MPKRREGPTKNKITGYYFFDEYVGLGRDKKRIRFSLKTKDPDKARWRWEHEYRKYWSEYYGIEPPVKPSKILFRDLANEFVDFEKNIKRIKEWEIVKGRLKIISDLWANVTLDKISKEHLIKLDDYLKKQGRSENTINHYFSLLKTLFNYAIKEGKYKGENPIREVTPYVIDQKRREYRLDDHGLGGLGKRRRPGLCDEDSWPQPGRNYYEISPS